MKCKLSIQEKLKDLRIERGLSLQELSEQTGLSRAALGNYETDDYKEITHKAIVILADFYGVTSDYLLGLTENREQHPFAVDELGLDDESVKIRMEYLCEIIKDDAVTHFYSSEPYGEKVAEYLNIENRQVDPERKKYPISASNLRFDLRGAQRWLESDIYDDLYC